MNYSGDIAGECQVDGRDTYSRHAVIKSESDNCTEIKNEILAIAKAFDFSDRELFAVHLAIEEALVNAVTHGNRCDPSCKINVIYLVAETEFRVRITDEGDGFDPRKVPDPTTDENVAFPSGRGLMLMRCFMSGIRHNERGNSVEMWLSRNQHSNSA